MTTEPPGPSAGERMVSEAVVEATRAVAPDGETRREYVERVLRAVARRIDAALAEREAMVTALREVLEEGPRAISLVRAWPCPLQHLPTDVYAVRLEAVNESARVESKMRAALTSTADAAARCLARARQEGAEEMRERAARVAEGCDSDTYEHLATHDVDITDYVAAAIRALDEEQGELARLRAEVRAERMKREATEVLMADAGQRQDALRALVAQLVGALREHGRHSASCELYIGHGGYPLPSVEAVCTCGLNAALAAAAPSLP